MIDKRESRNRASADAANLPDFKEAPAMSQDPEVNSSINGASQERPIEMVTSSEGAISMNMVSGTLNLKELSASANIDAHNSLGNDINSPEVGSS